MNKNVVRIQTELFKKDELVRGHMISIYLRPPRNYVWYPKQPKFQLLDDPEGAHTAGRPGQILRFEEGGLLFRFDALGAEADGATKGDIDYLLTIKTAAELFKDDIPHFATLISMSLDAFKDRAWIAQLAIYYVDAEKETVEFDALLTFEEDEAAVENQRAA